MVLGHPILRRYLEDCVLVAFFDRGQILHRDQLEETFL